MRRRTRVLLTLAVTALAAAYVLWKIDLAGTADVLREADLAWFGLAAVIMIASVIPMAVRWRWLLAAQGMSDRLGWLVRAYYVAYAAGQVLPTSLGGDAVRVVETTRRQPGRLGDVTAIVVLERGLGGAATLLLGAVGFLLAVGRYDVSAYLVVEGIFVFGTIALLVVFFARSARPLLARLEPLLARVRLDRPLRSFYEGVHHYRGHVRLLLGAFAFTVAIQAVRVLSLWASGKAVGVELGPRIYYVMGPLFFLVMLIPFTLNGFAVREAFFVSFLGSVGVAADQAFAAGLLFFLVTVLLAVPGAAILLWESARGEGQPRTEHG
jgi:uncharacterized protein (TIRG00374 family)